MKYSDIYSQADIDNFIDDNFEDYDDFIRLMSVEAPDVIVTPEMFMEEFPGRFERWLDGKDERIADQQDELSADIRSGK